MKKYQLYSPTKKIDTILAENAEDALDLVYEYELEKNVQYDLFTEKNDWVGSVMITSNK